METFLTPADWPLADQVLPLLDIALARLELGERLARVTVVLDEIASDERAWLYLEGQDHERRLTIWLHPDQFLQERPKSLAAGPCDQDWDIGTFPHGAEFVPSSGDFSPLNAQRTLFQQLLLVRDLLDGLLQPELLDSRTCEAFQEAWLVTVDGRLQRAGLPHLSVAQRRLRFLRVFAAGAVLTPSHWNIFNQLWSGELPDQTSVIAKIHLLPPLRRGWRP